MAEQSHREEMNAVIRAQRERQGTAPPPAADAPPEPAPDPEPDPAQEPSPFSRALGRLRGK